MDEREDHRCHRQAQGEVRRACAVPVRETCIRGGIIAARVPRKTSRLWRPVSHYRKLLVTANSGQMLRRDVGAGFAVPHAVIAAPAAAVVGV